MGEGQQEARGHTLLSILLEQVDEDLKSSTASEKHRKLQRGLAEWLASTGKVKSVRAEYDPLGVHKYDLYVEWTDGKTEAIEVMRRAAFGNIAYGRRNGESLLDYALRAKGHKECKNYSGSKLFAYSTAGGADMNSVCVPIETYDHVRCHMEKGGLRLSKVYTFEEGKEGFRAVQIS